MADPERGTKKVSQSAIKEIQDLGMSKAIAKYTSGGGSAEFRTAVERYYSPQRLKKASSEATPKRMAKPPQQSVDLGKKGEPVKMPESAPAAAQRRVAPKGALEGSLGKKNAEAVRSATKPIGKAGSAIAAQRANVAGDVGKTLSGLGKRLGVNNPFKPRKRK